MKRKLLTVLSATTLLLVSCGGSTDPADAFIEIANKANCALRALDDFRTPSDEIVLDDGTVMEVFEGEASSEPHVVEIQAVISKIASVEWPVYVLDDVDAFVTNLAKTVDAFEDDKTPTKLQFSVNTVIESGEVIKSKLGITDEQVPDTNDVEEMFAFCYE